MKIVHHMRMKNQIHYLMRSSWLFPTKPLPFYNKKIDFQDFLCPLPHTSESRMSRDLSLNTEAAVQRSYIKISLPKMFENV